MIRELLTKLQVSRSDCPLAIVLDPETYSSQAVAIHKIIGRIVICETDLAQMATFIVDCERQASGRSRGARARHIIGVAQLKGGVGATTLVASLGACYARNGLTVAMVDLDDVGAQLTEWGRVAVPQKLLIGQLLRSGEVTTDKLRDFVSPVEGFDGRFVTIGTPSSYSESFHLKSYILDGAPSSSDYMDSLLGLLSTEYDVVLIDLGRSWGVSTFASLPWCQRVVFVLDDDGLSVRRSLDTLCRLKTESGDAEEFNLSRWTTVLNRMSGERLSSRDVVEALDSIELFPKNPLVLPIGLSKRGRMWGEPGVSLYDLAEPVVRRQVEALASALIPEAIKTKTAAQRWSLPGFFGI
jgi:cellulose biosynthesis protein BcsQ